MSTKPHTLTFLIFATALVVSIQANAETVRKGLPACVTEDLLDEAITYVHKNDKNGFMQLMASGQCTILSSGEQVSVVSPGFMTATIRYRGVKMYTPSEAVR